MAKKLSSYMTRAMLARDPRFARVLERLGYERTDMVAAEPAAVPVPQPPPEPAPVDDRVALRVEYERVLGKRAFPGWSADQLREKIEEFRAREED